MNWPILGKSVESPFNVARGFISTFMRDNNDVGCVVSTQSFYAIQADNALNRIPQDVIRILNMTCSGENCLSSSISGFFTRQTKKWTQQTNVWTWRTMKILRHRAELMKWDSIADQMLVNSENSVREGETNLVNLGGLQPVSIPGL